MKVPKLKTAMAIFVVVGIYLTITPCNPDKSPKDVLDLKPDLKAVIDFLAEEDYTNNPDWHLFPGTDTAGDTLRRLGLPVHGRWVRTYVNNIAHEYLKIAVSPDAAEPLEFPPGSFLVKQNYRSNFDSLPTISSSRSTLGVLTLLFKPDKKFDYCATAHLEPYNGSDCYGGDWFYGFVFQEDFAKRKISKATQTIQDNVNSFCINCHAPGFNTDYVRSLDNIRNPFAFKSNTPYCDRFDKPKAMNFNLISSKQPGDLSKFSKEVSDYIENASLSSQLPEDVPFDPSTVFKFLGPEQTQKMFNSFAWKSFIALNWPNKGDNPTTNKPQRGEPDKNLPFTANGENSTVWETFKPTFEVFQPGDVAWDPVNQPWNQKPRTPQGTGCEVTDGDFVITMASKVRDVANETGQAFAGTFGFLVDQDSNLVRYEVLFNRTEFEYLIGNGRAATVNLTPGGPKGEAGKVNFPDNRDDKKYNQGAIEIKSAWKELCLTADCNQRDADDLEAAKQRFFVRKAVIYNADSTSCRLANMALVGLHIARKTYFTPQWTWITFEHQDNVPDAGQKPPTGTFYNSNLPEPENCYQLPFLANKPEVAGCPNVDLNRFVPELANQPNQLTRMVPINEEANALNSAFQKELKKINSPFANYVLVDTQWPLNGRRQDGKVNKFNCKDNGMGEDCFTSVPRFLRNSVIESYMSNYCNSNGKTEQFSNRSCMSCHGTAGADLSYVWLDAVSQRVKLTSENVKIKGE